MPLDINNAYELGKIQFVSKTTPKEIVGEKMQHETPKRLFYARVREARSVVSSDNDLFDYENMIWMQGIVERQDPSLTILCGIVGVIRRRY